VLIITDQQRRWWFATHPEFSSRGRGQRSENYGGSYDQYEDSADSVEAYRRELWRQAIEQDKKGLEPDPHTFLDVAPFGRFITSPIQAFKSALRRLAENTVVSAVKKGKGTGGPGQWVEVGRSRLGLEHQSKMSGQPIRESGGKYHINEYKIPTATRPVYFDDFRDGVLYEYEGSYGKLLNKQKVFYPWVKGAKAARDQAWRQVKASQGVPVVWRVGSHQVKAFNRAIGKIPGLTVVP